MSDQFRPYAVALAYYLLDGTINVPSGFVRRPEIISPVFSQTMQRFSSYSESYPDAAILEIVEQIIDDIVRAYPDSIVNDPIAGQYESISAAKIAEQRVSYLQNDEIYQRSKIIGVEQFFTDVFRSYDSLIHKEQWLPASDRMVPLNHNSAPYQEIADELGKIEDLVRTCNDAERPESRDQILKGMSAARTLWSATELKVIQVKVGIVMVLQDAKDFFGEGAKAVATSLLVDAIKAFVKSHLGIDLDRI